MSFSHSFLTCMKKKHQFFILQFVLICEGVLCKQKKKNLHELLFIINAST